MIAGAGLVGNGDGQSISMKSCASQGSISAASPYWIAGKSVNDDGVLGMAISINQTPLWLSVPFVCLYHTPEVSSSNFYSFLPIRIPPHLLFVYYQRKTYPT